MANMFQQYAQGVICIGGGGFEGSASLFCLKRHRIVHHEFFLKGQSLPSSIDKPYSSEKLAVVSERRDLLEPLELILALQKLIMLLWQQ